jgi:protein-S-isoprenylcysteine O-methyltransferase Ste14
MALNFPQKDVPGVLMPPPILYLSALLVGVLLDYAIPQGNPLGGAAPLIGIAALFVGAYGIFWVKSTLDRAGTPIDPRRPTTAIVTDGPFQYSRNPAYICLSLIYLGLALLVGGMITLVFLPVIVWIMIWGVIEQEEAYLERKFGAQYLDYKARVPRWLRFSRPPRS